MRALLTLAAILLAGCTQADPAPTPTPVATSVVPPSDRSEPISDPTPEAPATAPTATPSPSPTPTPSTLVETTLHERTFNFLSTSAAGRFEYAFEVPEGSRDLNATIVFRRGAAGGIDPGVPTVSLKDPAGLVRTSCNPHSDCGPETIPAPEPGTWSVKYEEQGDYEADVKVTARVPG